jgi:mono/diheme cytochrome c family protein
MERTASGSALRLRRLVLLASALGIAACGEPSSERSTAPRRAPQRLAETGLYADFAARRLADGVLAYSPQYPLWSDGAAKERWVALPPGTAIDGSDPDHWVFPVGTRFWKEFRFEGAVETRFLERREDGSWLYATYRWSADGSEALLAPDCGVRGVCATSEGERHDLPSIADCRACHEGTRTPVLGFSALQLSPDRDPLAPHAEEPEPGDVDLTDLVERGLLRGFPGAEPEHSPRIAARSAIERAALGYLHGNCASCHNADGPLQRLGLRFDHPLAATTPPALATTVGVASAFRRPELTQRVVAGSPDRSVLLHRLAARDPVTQMPPLGRHLVDREASELLRTWIERELVACEALTRNTTTTRRP